MTDEVTDVKQVKRPFKKSKRRSKFDPKTKFGSINKSQKHELEIREIDRKLREFNPENANKFEDFPLTKATLKGLAECNYIKPTLIQKLSLPLALQGSNILGAAKTGSGKTLAFVIPILERLYKLKWNPTHGVGALIITPTKELTQQIFTIFKKVGKYHQFSAGAIGGNDVEEEKRRLANMNIIISCPGRLNQHLRETSGFDLNTVQLFVLDEADRLLDMGFKTQINNIIDSLSDERQTLLYSATQTRCRTDLQRLNWKNYFLVCEKVTDKSDLISMPPKLEQIYMVCKAEEKVNLLYSFLVQDIKRKILVFMSTCKQVRFIHEVFQEIHKDATFLAIHGSMKQKKRSEMFEKFSCKKHCIMFATDVACRGLDFPAVDWVVQLDCPADADTYVHRVGRTARYEDDGMSLLFLLPSEKEGMIKELEKKGIVLQEERPKKGKIIDIETKLKNLVIESNLWEDYARKALLTYLKSVFYMTNKEIFDIYSIDQEALARSLGLGAMSKTKKGIICVQDNTKEKTITIARKRKRDEDGGEKSLDFINKESDKMEPLARKQNVRNLSIIKGSTTRIVFGDEPEEIPYQQEAQAVIRVDEKRKYLFEKDTEDSADVKEKQNKKKKQMKKKALQQQREEQEQYDEDVEEDISDSDINDDDENDSNCGN